MRALELTTTQAAVMSLVCRVGLVDRANVAKQCGASPEQLSQLVRARCIQCVPSQRRDGSAGVAYRATVKGSNALREYRQRAAQAPAGSTVAASRMPFSEHVYMGAELQPYEGRPGAMDAFSLPSRVGRRRYYRGGAIELIDVQQTGGAE